MSKKAVVACHHFRIRILSACAAVLLVLYLCSPVCSTAGAAPQTVRVGWNYEYVHGAWSEAMMQNVHTVNYLMQKPKA